MSESPEHRRRRLRLYKCVIALLIVFVGSQVWIVLVEPLVHVRLGCGRWNINAFLQETAKTAARIRFIGGDSEELVIDRPEEVKRMLSSVRLRGLPSQVVPAHDRRLVIEHSDGTELQLMCSANRVAAMGRAYKYSPELKQLYAELKRRAAGNE